MGGSTEESAELTCGRGGFVRKKEIGRVVSKRGKGVTGHSSVFEGKERVVSGRQQGSAENW